MKKLISLFLAAIVLISSFAFFVFAEEETASSVSRQEEFGAGFLFDRVIITLKYGHSFEDTTPDMLDEGIESLAYLYDSFNYESDYGWFTNVIVGYLKEPSKENVIKLILSLRENEYVEKCEPQYIGAYFPIFPESPSEIPLMHGSYTVWTKLDERTEIEKNMLKNPYYQKYYDKLLAYSVSCYNRFSDYMGDMDYTGYYADTYITENCQYVTLILKTPESYTGSVRDYNLSIFEKYFDSEDILYVGDTVFAAVIRVSKDDAEIIKGMAELAFIGDAFFDRPESMITDSGSFRLGDVVDADFYVTAADARRILRYSAGSVTDRIYLNMQDIETDDEDEKRYYELLYSGAGTEKLFYFSADVNMDNKINAQDARLALRAAAKLEPTYIMNIRWFGWNDYAFLEDLIFYEYFGEFPDNV